MKLDIHDDFVLIEDNVFDKETIDNLDNWMRMSFHNYNDTYKTITRDEFPYYDHVWPMVQNQMYHYCAGREIDAERVNLCNFQLASLPPYDESMANENFYEPHDDIAERYWAVTIVYCTSEYTDDNWVGGELAIYKNTTYLNYPQNIINIKPYRNRMVMFPGYYMHRIKPYFGKLPRQSLVYGWEIDDKWKVKPIVV
jgi:hypothetical protein